MKKIALVLLVTFFFCSGCGTNNDSNVITPAPFETQTASASLNPSSSPAKTPVHSAAPVVTSSPTPTPLPTPEQPPANNENILFHIPATDETASKIIKSGALSQIVPGEYFIYNAISTDINLDGVNDIAFVMAKKPEGVEINSDEDLTKLDLSVCPAVIAYMGEDGKVNKFLRNDTIGLNLEETKSTKTGRPVFLGLFADDSGEVRAYNAYNSENIRIEDILTFSYDYKNSELLLKQTEVHRNALNPSILGSTYNKETDVNFGHILFENFDNKKEFKKKSDADSNPETVLQKNAKSNLTAVYPSLRFEDSAKKEKIHSIIKNDFDLCNKKIIESGKTGDFDLTCKIASSDGKILSLFYSLTHAGFPNDSFYFATNIDLGSNKPFMLKDSGIPFSEIELALSNEDEMSLAYNIGKPALSEYSKTEFLKLVGVFDSRENIGWDGGGFSFYTNEYYEGAGFHIIMPEKIPTIVSSAEVLAPQGAIVVSNVDELVKNLGPNRHIVLKPGRYNFSDLAKKIYASKKPSKHTFSLGKGSVYFAESYEDVELVLDGIENLTIEGTGNFETEIVTEASYSEVIKLLNCNNVTLKNLVLGHYKIEGTCTGDVIGIASSKNIHVEKSLLYGCGANGLEITNSSDFFMENSIIEDCSYGIMTIVDSKDLNFKNNIFRDMQSIYGFSFTNSSNLTFTSCEIHNILSDSEWNQFIENNGASNVKFITSDIHDNYFESGQKQTALKGIEFVDTKFSSNNFSLLYDGDKYPSRQFEREDVTVGGIKWSMSVNEVTKILGEPVAEIEADDFPTVFTPHHNYSFKGLDVGFYNGKVYYASVKDDSFKTSLGIGVSSTLEEVFKTYGYGDYEKGYIRYSCEPVQFITASVYFFIDPATEQVTRILMSTNGY